MGADSLEWCETGVGGGDVSDEYFDSRSWHSDTLSDLSLDREDPVDSPLSLDNVFTGQQSTGGSYCSRQTKAQQREPVTAKDIHRYTTETYSGQSTCSRRKSPENHLDRSASYKLCTKELDPFDIQHHPSTEKLKHDLHQESSCLQAVCTETQVKASTELLRLKVTGQCNTDTFNTEVNSRTGGQGVCFHVPPGEGSPKRPRDSTDSETCTIRIDITEDKIETEHCNTHEYQPRLETRETAQSSTHNASLDRFDLCNHPVEAENIELLSTCSVEKSNASNRCNNEHINKHPRHRDDSKGYSKLCKKSGAYCYGTQLEATGNCTDHSRSAETHFSDEVNEHIFHSTCSPVNFKPTFGKDSPNSTTGNETKTGGASDNTRTKPQDTPEIQVAISRTVGCCSQAASGKSNRRELPEIEHQVCASVKRPQDHARVSCVCSHTEEFGCDRSTKGETKQLGTVNEICSAITFTTQTTACNTLDTRTTEPPADPKASALDLPGRLARSEVVKERKPDHKQSQNAILQSLQAQTQELIPNQLDQKGSIREKSPRCQLNFAETTLPSSCLETCSDSNSGKHLPYHQVSNHSRNRGEEEDASHLSSDNLQGEGSWVGLCSPPQSEHGKTELSDQMKCRVFPCIASDASKHMPTGIEEISTCPALSECVQDSSPKHIDVAPKVITSENIQTTVDAISSQSKKVNLELRIPESFSGQQSSLSQLADSNNNKAGIKGVEKGEVCDSSAAGVQINYEINERLSCLLVKPLQNVASDCVKNEGTTQEKSEVFPSPLDLKLKFSRVDCDNSLGKSHDSHSHLRLTLDKELQKLKTEKGADDNAVADGLDLKDHIQVSSTDLQQGEGRTVRYPQPDICFSLQGVTCLEPIVEAERSLENCGTLTDGRGTEDERECVILRPAEKAGDNANLSGDSSIPKSIDHQPEQKEEYLTGNDLEPAIISATPTLCTGSEKRHRLITGAYDAASYSSASSSSDAMEKPHLSIWARSNNSNKVVQKSKTKGNQPGNKASKFSVFAKMPSFRKSKGSKGAKIEEVSQESSDGGDEGSLSEQEPQRDNLADNILVKHDMLSQTVHQALSSSHSEIEEEDCDFFSSTPHSCQGSSEEGNEKLSPNDPTLKQVQTPDGQTYKRSKSNDSLNIRMRFAQAHKSLSSLFESRSVDKDNTEQTPVTTGVDSDTAKQCWAKMTQATDVEQLKRTLSLPDGDCRNIARGQGLRDIMSSPLLERHCSLGSPSSLRSLRHTDPISKRGVPQGSVEENSHGCSPEGHRMHDLLPSFNDSAVPLPNSTSLVSHANHCLPATPINQVSPSWTRSHPGPTEDFAKSPVRPMSPKPNSPRPASQRKSFCFSHSARVKSVSPILLGQSVSIDGLTDPPKRPKTLKPSSSPLCLSLNPLDATDSRIHSQSHIRMYANGSINELEVRKLLFLSRMEEIL